MERRVITRLATALLAAAALATAGAAKGPSMSPASHDTASVKRLIQQIPIWPPGRNGRCHYDQRKQLRSLDLSHLGLTALAVALLLAVHGRRLPREPQSFPEGRAPVPPLPPPRAIHTGQYS